MAPGARLLWLGRYLDPGGMVGVQADPPGCWAGTQAAWTRHLDLFLPFCQAPGRVGGPGGKNTASPTL